MAYGRNRCVCSPTALHGLQQCRPLSAFKCQQLSTHRQRSLLHTRGRGGRGASLGGEAGEHRARAQSSNDAGGYTGCGVAVQLADSPHPRLHCMLPAHACPSITESPPGSGSRGVAVHSQPALSSWYTAAAEPAGPASPAAPLGAPSTAVPPALLLAVAGLHWSALASSSSYSGSVSRRAPAQRA